MVKTVTTSSSSGDLGRRKKDDKTSFIDERSSKPPGTSRFSRKRNEEQVMAAQILGATTPSSVGELLTDADFCRQLLVGGFVQSYVDFYHLTHRIDPNAGEGNSTSKIQVTLEDMTFIKDNLVKAEVARRQGNTPGVYISYNRLADYYVEKCDWRTSIYFHEKCLEVAKLTSDSRAEMAALHSLGTVNQKMGDFDTARVFHEKHGEQQTVFKFSFLHCSIICRGASEFDGRCRRS